MWSILRLISHKIAPQSRGISPISRCGRKFSTAADRQASPWLMLPPSFSGGDMEYRFFSVRDEKIESFNNRGGREEAELMRDDKTQVLGSSHGWLALFNQSRNYDMFLLNPLSGRRIALPPAPLDDVKGLGFGFGCGLGFLPKVIISCSPEDEACRAMLILSTMDGVAFCSPGRSNEWTYCYQGIESKSYDDFVYSSERKSFLGYCHSFRAKEAFLEGWNVADQCSPRMNRIYMLKNKNIRPTNSCNLYRMSFKNVVFVEQTNQLFLVKRYIHKDLETTGTNCVIDFDVYRIDDSGGVELCSSLDGVTMFVGLNHSFAVMASEFPELKPNSIYYSDERMHWVCDGHQIGIFDYQNRTWCPHHYSIPSPSDDTFPFTPMMPWFTPSFN